MFDFVITHKKIDNENYQIISINLYTEVLNEIEFQNEFISAIKAVSHYQILKQRGRCTIHINGNYYLIFINTQLKTIFFFLQNAHFESNTLQITSKSSHINSELQLELNELHRYQRIPDIFRLYYTPTLLHKIDLPETANKEFINTKEKLTQFIKSYKYSLIERLLNFSLGLVCDYQTLRLQLLKFIAAVPSVSFDHSGLILKKLFQEMSSNILGSNEKMPWYIKPSVRISNVISKILPGSLFKEITEFSISIAAKRFICSENKDLAKKIIQHLHNSNRACTLDQLGELVTCKQEADEYCQKITELILNHEMFANSNKKNIANLPFHHISIKTSALSAQFIEDPDAFNFVYQDIEPRLFNIFTAANKSGAFLNFDAEHYGYRDLTPKLIFYFLERHSEFKAFKNFGFVLQAYLKDSSLHYTELKQNIIKRNHFLPIRLVKGAYWDGETIEATAKNFSSPQFLNKTETDIQFRHLIHQILSDYEQFQLCLASHNIDDHCYAEVVRKIYYPNAHVIEHQTLHMTYEPLSVACQKMNWAIRNYLPTGSLLMGMGYLVRRIMENASQTGVLTAVRHKKFNPNDQALIQNLYEIIQNKKYPSELSDQLIGSKFIQTTTSRLFVKSDYLALKSMMKNINLNSFKINDGSEIQNIYSKFNHHNLLGNFLPTKATETENIIKQSQIAFTKWQTVDSNIRAQLLLQTAILLKFYKYSLASLIIEEAGKTRNEALADVDEAIDFLNYYAFESQKINFNEYSAFGVFAIIAPWNFPLAIICGMAAAALACGNTVILKPAEQTPLIGKKLHELLLKAGFDKTVVQIACGYGEITGATLVNSSQVNGIVFTGSKTIGVSIYQKSLYKEIKTNQPPRRVITEMGGKNAIIVCDDAEIDLAITSAIYSAFAHAGQKCSACSRIIIQESIFKSFSDRLVLRATEIKVDSPEFAETFINPLISQEEVHKTINNSIRMKEYSVKYSEKILIDLAIQKNASCVGPVIIAINQKSLQDKSHPVYQEMFAPLLYLIPFKTLEEAVNIFNNTSYALTGGAFTQSDNNIEFFIKNLKAGNLYFNRNITGARVAIEPFGGFRLSGTGPKAGGPEYLRSFVYPTKVAKKLMFNETLKTNHIEEAKTWLENAWNISLSPLDKFSNSTEPLLKIPGQKNYLDYSIKKEKLLFITDNTHTTENFLKLIYMADYFLISFQIICLTSECEVIFKNSPFALKTTKYNFDILNNDIDLVIYQANNENERKITNYFADEKFYQTKMLQLLNANFLHENISLFDLVKLLSETRTIAINTMRYGAPLDEE